MPKKKITITAVKALKPGETLWDTELRGFGCRCQKSGKFFILKYSLNGRQRFYTIGEWSGALTPEQARKKAIVLRGGVSAGIDPMSEKEKMKATPFVKDSFPLYLEDVKDKRSAKTHEAYNWLYNNIIKKKLGNYRVDAIARADIARIHRAHKDTPYHANRLLAVLSAFFSWCEKHGHRPEGVNPCRHIDKYKETPRERFLSEEELARLGEALQWYEEEYLYLKEQPHKKDKNEERQKNPVIPFVTAALRLLILTGARRNEILTLQWKDVDFERRLIRLQESKTGQKTIYLSAPALQILSELPRIEGNPHVICGRKDGAHLVNLKDPWDKIRKKAGLEDVRVHDLRHNYASTAVTSGHHLKVIGSLLGHSEIKTTERYAHLANDPLQMANEAISNRILQAMSGKSEKENIVPLRKD